MRNNPCRIISLAFAFLVIGIFIGARIERNQANVRYSFERVEQDREYKRVREERDFMLSVLTAIDPAWGKGRIFVMPKIGKGDRP